MSVLHQILIVIVASVVTFILRAMPFLFFSGGRQQPPWLRRVSDWISPVVLVGLVIYAYTGLQWKMSAPYLAGALTVALQLIFKNSLVSIIAGTALYMILI